MQHSAGRFRRYGRFTLEQHIARVKPFVHLHNGYAGLFVPRFNGALYRRRSPPPRQQGRMRIETAFGKSL